MLLAGWFCSYSSISLYLSPSSLLCVLAVLAGWFCRSASISVYLSPSMPHDFPTLLTLPFLFVCLPVCVCWFPVVSCYVAFKHSLMFVLLCGLSWLNFCNFYLFLDRVTRGRTSLGVRWIYLSSFREASVGPDPSLTILRDESRHQGHVGDLAKGWVLGVRLKTTYPDRRAALHRQIVQKCLLVVVYPRLDTLSHLLPPIRGDWQYAPAWKKTGFPKILCIWTMMSASQF